MLLERSNLTSLFPRQNVDNTYVDVQSTRSDTYNVQPMGENTVASLSAKEKYSNVAITDSKFWKRVVNRIVDCGDILLAITAANVVILDNNTIGVGAILCLLSQFTSNTPIGKYFH